MDYLLAVTLFAISSSVTPGPNNIMVMTSGVNFGVKKSLPLLIGICLGFSIMLLVVGFGFAQLFALYPTLHFIIKCVGVGYLLYLAWLIASSNSEVEKSRQATPFSFMKGALFQWVNAKAWIVATGAIAAFTSSGGDLLTQQLIISLTFFIVSFPCVGVWLLFGSMLQNALNSQSHRRIFNLFMAGLLVLSVLPVMHEIISQLLK